MSERSSFAQVVAAALVASALAGPSAAAPSLVGTLTCTAEPMAAPATDPGGWKVTCAFEQVGKGSVQHYGGQIEGLERGPRAAGKALLIWNVLAESALDTGGLVGTYKAAGAGGGAGQPPRSLVGGRGQPVILQPLNADPAAAPAVSLLQLELPKA
jgi:Protein of unknown function (DUF992)